MGSQKNKMEQEKEGHDSTDWRDWKFGKKEWQSLSVNWNRLVKLLTLRKPQHEKTHEQVPK